MARARAARARAADSGLGHGGPARERGGRRRVHGQWLGRLSNHGDKGYPPSFERWIVCAPGHRPASGDLASARRAASSDGLEEWLVDVALEPGWSEAVLFKDAQGDSPLVPELDFIGAPLAGVRVLADGVVAATSDGDGLALVALERAPRTLVYSLAGWDLVQDLSDGKSDVHYAWMVRR